MSILITAANAAQAYQLRGVLNAEAPVLLGDYQDIPDLLVQNGQMIKTPNPNTSSFIHQMLALCLDRGVTAIYPLRKAEQLLLAEAALLFNEFEITLNIPEKGVLDEAAPNVLVDGKIVIIEKGNVVLGCMDSLLALQLKNGVFKVNSNGAYQIFTAD